MKIKLFLSLFLVITLIKLGVCQDEMTAKAPSLQIGLSGFDFTKGAIDPVILGQLISEKQEEVKVKLIKSMLLKNIGYNNALFYNYINNTIDVITKQKDINTLSKNLLENTVNLVFVVSFTEYYINSNLIHPKLNLLMEKLGKSNKSLNKISVIHNNLGEGSDPIKEEDKKVNASDMVVSILIDMSSDVIQNNKKLAALGVLRTSYFQNSSINNSYLDAIQDPSIEIERDNGTKVTITKNELIEIHDEMAGILNLYISYFNIIKKIIATSSNDSIVNITEVIANIKEVYPIGKTKIEDIMSLVMKAIQTNKTVLKDKDIAVLTKFFEDLKFIKNRPDEIMFIYENNVKPFFDKLNSYDTSFVLINYALNNYVYSIIVCDTNLKDKLEKLYFDEYAPFIQLLFTLNDFDKVETYNKYLDYLGNSGNVFANSQMRKSINQIISFVRGFIKPTATSTYPQRLTFNIDVQGFIASLVDMPFNRSRPFQIMFTIGANNLFFLGKEYQHDSNNKVGNLSYMSEKIGLKWKLYDAAYTQSFNRGDVFHAWGRKYLRLQPPKEPTISNVHLLAYGSGLLYNLVNLKTETNFNSSLFGFGLGITFFNDLDFNITFGKPFELYKGVPWFFNVGFDVRISEYLAKLNKQRNDKKTFEKLNQAYQVSKEAQNN